MSIRYIFNNYKKQADILYSTTGIKYDGDPAKTVITQMLDGYCQAKDTNDEKMKNLYISGLMLRFWFVINKYKLKSPGLNLDETDFVFWLYEAIEYACKYRAWQKPNAKLNAQQCINQCVETIRKQHYYEFNLDKHRANYNTVSMNTPLADDDEKFTLENTLEDSDAEQAVYNYAEDPAKQLIQSFIDRNKIVEAIILDTIAFNDSQKLVKTTNTYFDSATGKNKKFVSYVEKLWPYKVVKNLNSLTDDYEKYFNLTYSINPEKFTAAFNSIKKANNTKLYKFLDATLEDARNNCIA